MDQNIVDNLKEPTDIGPDEVLVEETEKPMSFTQSKQVCTEDFLLFLCTSSEVNARFFV